MKKSVPVILLLIAVLSFTTYNKDMFQEHIISKLEEYDSKNFPEKIYLHTDKPFYTLNESIWFTGYMVNGINHLKSNKSMVMHVDLIDSNDSIMDSKNIYISRVTGAGDFKISKKWKPGKYLLRAYTNEMRNINTDDFFQKEITVLATVDKDSTSLTEQASLNISEEQTKDDYTIPRPDLKFFPEGGYLIDGMANKVAIKVMDPIFKNKILKGKIVDNDKNELFTFSSAKFGMGLFLITPEVGKTYTAIVDINGSEERYALPKSLEKGYQISIVNSGANISINLNSNTRDGLKGTTIVAHQRGKYIYSKTETSIQANYKLNFPTKSMDDGIIHFTLFNPQGNPVAERLVYVENPNNRVTITATPDKKDIGTRQKMTLSIDAKNPNGKTIAGSLSISIRDMKALPQNNYVENIKTYLLLNSDLRGRVDNPGYFFENPNDPKKRYLLDLTMMTNGWRRFTWQSLLHEPLKEKPYPIEKGLFIEGTTKLLKKPYSVLSTPTRLTFLGNDIHQENQQSDSLGNFKFGPYVFFDSIATLIESRLYSFSSKKRKNRNIVILLNNTAPNKPKVLHESSLENTPDKAQLEAFLKISKYIEQINIEYEQQMQLLDEVVIIGKKKDEIELRNEEFDSRTLHGSSEKRVVIDDVMGADNYTIYELLRRLPGISVSGTSVSIRGGGTPEYYLDGMAIDSSFVDNIIGSDIDFIDVLTGADAAIYSNSSNGIIALYSRTGANIKSKNIKRKPGIIDFQAEGFYTTRKFFAPDHINGFEEMSKADMRTTLHWEPDIRILPNKTAEISFFSCDSRGDYVIDIQGISDSGIPFYDISTFTVK
jgi:hypothetical protein